MPSVIKFLGCSVKSFTSNAAWGNSPATLTVNLVPDLRDGDQFTYEANGQDGIWDVYTFTAGSFRFRGFISNWSKERSESSNPTYSVTLSDCREILNATKIITSHYYGQTNVVPNVINAFGFWEVQLGFGNSLSNDAGMPWQLILKAVNSIVNNGSAPLYGGNLRWKNTNFTVDLSQIPVPPLYYKISGQPSISLLQCIDQVCNDAGRDWYCETTEDNVIRIKTISRKAQLLYNRKSITEYANSIRTAKNINSGWEGVNDRATSKLLFGSNVSYLYHSPQAGMYPYWGTDINGNFLYSVDLSDSTPVTLNASIAADVLGSSSYDTTVGEIRVAMFGEQAWLNYVAIKNPTLALRLGIPAFYDQTLIDKLKNGTFTQAGPGQLLNNLNVEATRFYNSIIGANNTQYEKMKRVHQMISQAGQNFMGKSYLVYLPFVLTGYDPETTEIFYSYTVDSEGGYVGLGDDLLGMNDYNRLLFESSAGRLGPFATFGNSNVTSEQVMNTNTVVQINGIYVKCGIETEIKRVPFPCVIVHLANQLTEQKQTVYFAPIIDWINIVLNGANESLIKSMLKNNLGVFPVGVGACPKPKLPTYISVPLRSRIETYGGSISGRGHWNLTGISANTDVEQDNDLNPWSFGGYYGMNLAATAKLFQISSNQHAVEFGSMVFPGLPNHSLGDELRYQGSNITSIDVSVSDGGFVTTYRLRAFDPNIIGSLAKREEARFRRIGTTLSKLRREAKDIYERIFNNLGPTVNGSLQNYNIHPALAPRSPHSLIACRNWNFDNGTAFHEMASLTPTEALANIDTRSSTSYKQFSMMSMNGMFRPFSTKTTRTDMPAYVEPVTNLLTSDNIYTANSLNQFKDENDIFMYSKGDSMSEDARTVMYDVEGNALQYTNQGTSSDVRGIGLKMPINMVGYGFDFTCNATTVGGTGISSNDRKKSQLWKAGPLDPLFDQIRGCWTFHDTICGKVVGDIAAKSSSSWVSGGVRIVGRDDTLLTATLPVYNIHNSLIASGSMVTATYNAQSNRFIIQSADC